MKVEADGRFVSGIAVPYNTPAVVLVGGAVVQDVMDEESIPDPPVGVPWLVGHHDDAEPIGVVLETRNTPEGLAFDAELLGSNSEIEGRREKISRHAYGGVSIGFMAPKDGHLWERSGDLPLRRVRNASIHELSLVVFPAYRDAQVHAITGKSPRSIRSDAMIRELKELAEATEAKLAVWKETRRLRLEAEYLEWLVTYREEKAREEQRYTRFN